MNWLVTVTLPLSNTRMPIGIGGRLISLLRHSHLHGCPLQRARPLPTP